MTSRKRRRLLGVTTALVLTALSNDLVFFYSPSDILAQHVPDGRYIRVGGLVAQGSVKHDAGTLDFRITDGKNAVAVTYRGDVPDLFREGQGVVAEGKLEHGTFRRASIRPRSRR
jgi:cytochrome c-type biogenesis protein CcmE